MAATDSFGLHLAARIRDRLLASKLMPILLRCAPGAESTADYAMTRHVEPAVTFGYGMIDAVEIAAALKGMRRMLEKGAGP